MLIISGLKAKKETEEEQFKWKQYYAKEIVKSMHLLEKYEIGSPEYAAVLEHIEWLKDCERKDKEKPVKREIPYTGIAALLGVLVSGAGLAVQLRGQEIQKRELDIRVRAQDIQMDMAKAAWENDHEMLMCNNKLWNMKDKVK